MRSKALSRSSINMQLRELQLEDISCVNRASDAVITVKDYSTVGTRLNALVTLGDTCMKYTNLVETHIPIIAKSLQDRDVVIRKHGFLMLIQVPSV